MTSDKHAELYRRRFALLRPLNELFSNAAKSRNFVRDRRPQKGLPPGMQVSKPVYHGQITEAHSLPLHRLRGHSLKFCLIFKGSYGTCWYWSGVLRSPLTNSRCPADIPSSRGNPINIYKLFTLHTSLQKEVLSRAKGT